MDQQPDSKTCEIENGAKHLYSVEKQDTLGKDKGLSNSCQRFTDKNMVLEKQGHLSPQEINSCEADSLPEMENCPDSDHVSASDCSEEGIPDKFKQRTSVISASRNLFEIGICDNKVLPEGMSGATSCSNGFTSSTVQNKLACDGNPKDGEVSILSLGGIDFTQHMSVNSDISSETGPPLNRTNNESDVGRTHANCLNAGEDGLKSVVHATFHDIQAKTESSSSNSTQTILPVSSSNGCYQEMSVEDKSSKHNGSGMNGSVCTEFNSSMEGPATGSVVLGMAAQITQKAVDNVRARDGKKVVRMTAGQNSMLVEKVDIQKSSLSKQKNVDLLSQHDEELSYELDDALGVPWKVAREVEHKVGIYREVSGSSCSMEERNGETAHLSSVDSADPKKSNYSIETRQGIKLCNEKDNHDSFHSYKEVVNPDLPMKNKHFLAVKAQSQEMDCTMMHEANDGCHGHELPQLTTKTEDKAASGQTPLHSRFDLNEDLPTNEVEYPRQLVGETVSFDDVINVSMPVPMMAKSGVPLCLPMIPLKFEGELGWKGSAATSAFRPPAFFKSSSRNTSSSSINDNNFSSKHSQGFTGFDLNVVAVEDDSAMELPRKSIAIPTGFPFEKSSADVSSKRAEMLNFDLNRLGEDDDCPRPSLPVSLSRCSMVDFDLNDNPSLGETCNDAHWSGQGNQPLSNKALADASVSFVGNSRQLDFSNMRPAYWGDLRSMQGFNHGHAQPYMVASPNVLQPMEPLHRVVPLHPKLPYTPQTLPSHGYPYNNAFYMGPADPLSSTMHSSGVLPYITDSHGTSVMPQIFGPGTLPTFHGAPHFMEVAYGRSPIDTTNIRPSFDVNSVENSSENGSRGSNTRQFLFPARKSLMEGEMKAFQQVALSATHVKRKEPEAGWDSYQLGYRHVTSWN